MKIITDNLKPCPHCGGEAFLRIRDNHIYIDCFHKDDCLIKPDTWLQSAESIRKQMKAWNRRTK